MEFDESDLNLLEQSVAIAVLTLELMEKAEKAFYLDGFHEYGGTERLAEFRALHSKIQELRAR